jgi:propanediol dehydratase large subunit
VTPTAYEKAAREEATRGLYALLSENDPRHNYAYTRGKVLTLEQAVVFAMG